MKTLEVTEEVGKSLGQIFHVALKAEGLAVYKEVQKIMNAIKDDLSEKSE